MSDTDPPIDASDVSFSPIGGGKIIGMSTPVVHPTTTTGTVSGVPHIVLSSSGVAHAEPRVTPHKGSPHPDTEVDLVAGYARLWADDEPHRPHHLKMFCAAIVDLRQRFAVTRDGHVDPDWRGTTWEYRDSVTEAFHRSGITKENQRRLQNNARYHVGNLVRERATPEELERSGLKLDGPLARANDKVSAADIRRALEDLVATIDEVFPAIAPAGMLDAIARAREVLE